jgi:DNA polymerase family A
MKLVAVDFETLLTPEISLKKLPLDAYLDKAPPYLAATWDEVGGTVFNPQEPGMANLSALFDGVISHNAGFERGIIKRLGWSGWLELPWFDSADMAAYFQRGRSLEAAAKNLLSDLPPKVEVDFKAQEQVFSNPVLQERCLHDARLSWELWKRYGHLWPLHEQELSALTRESAERGCLIDWPRLREYKEKLQVVMEHATALVPWTPTGSPKKFRQHCEVACIPVPKSTRIDDESYLEWLEEYGERVPFVKSINQKRRANRIFRILQALEARRRADGCVRTELLYCGTDCTQRWAGCAGINFQNLSRESFEGVDLRGLIVARPEHVLIVCDLEQIEPRCAAWLSGNLRFFDFLEKSGELYSMEATQMGLWNGEGVIDKNTRALAKVATLSLGYQAGVARFHKIARKAGLHLSETEAARMVYTFRTTHPHLTALWNALEKELIKAYRNGGKLALRLPSGRTMRYWDIRCDDPCEEFGDLTAITRIGDRDLRRKIYSGVLTENVVSGTARDVFCNGLLLIRKAGINVLFSAHDEVIAEVPMKSANDAFSTVIRCLETTPDWIPGLRIKAAGSILTRYAK